MGITYLGRRGLSITSFGSEQRVVRFSYLTQGKSDISLFFPFLLNRLWFHIRDARHNFSTSSQFGSQSHLLSLSPLQGGVGGTMVGLLDESGKPFVSEGAGSTDP